MGKCDLDTDVDENGEPITPHEPKVSAKTGKRRKAKPTAISKSKIERIANLVRAGNYVKPSVLACGVNYSTFLSYMQKGKKGIRPYDEYYELIEQAKGEFETRAVGKISESGENGNIGAYMWMLPRMFPQRWQSTQRSEVKVDNSQTIEIVKYSDKKKE
jgi:hypothetical protein